MKKMRKLLMAIFATMLPIAAAWADDVAKIGDTGYATLQEAVNAAKDLGGAQTINLLSDISGETVTIQEVANFQLTIDGQKDATSNYTVDAQIIVDGLRGNNGSPSNGASVTLKNIAFVNSAAKDAIKPQHYPHNLTIQDCTYTGSDASSDNWFMNIGDGPLYGATIKNLTVENTRLIQGDLSSEVVFENIVATNNVTAGFNIKTGDSGGFTGTVLIKNCQITTGKYALRDYKDGYTGTITLEDNTFISTSTGSDEGVIVNRGGASSARINVTSGTYTGRVVVLNGKDALNISGGTFTDDVTNYLAEGYSLVNNNGFYTVFEGNPPVAKINDTYYASLAEAVAAANNGDTITLLADLSDLGSVYLPAGVTLDGDGKTISGNSAVYVNKAGGSVQNVNFESIHNANSKLSAIYGNSLEGTATITGCSFSNCDWDAIQITPVAGAVLIITNNTFRDDTNDGIKQQRYVHVQSAQNVDFSATVTGNVMYGHLKQEPMGVYYPTDETKVDLKLNYIEAIDEVCILMNNNSGYAGNLVFPAYTSAEKTETYSPVAMIKNSDYAAKFYATLEAAFAAAADGAAIILLADCVGNGIKVAQGKYTTGLTVDFNGHTYTMDGAMVGSTGTQTQAFQLLKDNKITFKNGTITSEKAKILVQNYSNLTLEGMTLTLNNSSYSSAYTLSNNNGNVVIDGSTINANPAGGFAFDVCRYSSYPSVSVEVKDNSTINGNIEIFASNNDAKDGFGLTLTSGTISGNIVMDATAAAAMAATPDKVTITKSEAFSQAAPEGYKWVCTDGTCALAACEYVAQYGDKKYESLQEALDAAEAENPENIVIELLSDATLDITARANVLSIGTESTQSITINGNNHTLTFNQKNSDWNDVSTANDEVTKLILNDMSITNSGYNNGPWNRHDINFNCAVELNNVTSDKALAFKNDAKLKNVEITETGDVYGIWIQTNGQNVSIDGLTMNVPNGRGIAVKDQYVNSAPAETTTLSITNSTFTTGKKAAILVTAKYGAAIEASGLDIENVAADNVNAVWVDEDLAGQYGDIAFTSEDETMVPEGGVAAYKAALATNGNIDGYYKTFAAAIEAAAAAQSVVLLQDIDLGAESLSISKALTIDGGGQYGITSSATQAVLLTGNGAATFKDVAIVASAGHGIQAGNDDAAYSGQLTLDGATLTVAKRGIRVYNEDTGFGIAVDGSVIQSNVADPTTIYTTGNDAMALSLGTTDGKGYTVTINNSELKGFSYDINSVTSGSNLTVTMTGGKTYGRAALNVWGSNNTFTLDGVEVHGLNNETGSTEAFACIVEYKDATDNNYNINGVTFIANLSEAAISTVGSSATQQMVDLRGTGATMKITGNTTYTCNSEERGGLFYNEGTLETSTVLMDATAKGNLEQLIKKATVASEPDANGLYAVTYVSEVYYYWIANGVEDGENCDFVQPFIEGWLADGEFIRLKKDVTLTGNIACQLESGLFTLTQGDFSITKGDYTVTLKAGVSVVTDKQTDIFSAADAANYTVVETEVNGKYTYSVEELPNVAMIGETGYKTLAAAVAAVPTDGTETTITMIANEIISVSGYALTVAANQNVVLDLNGHQVVGTCETSGTSALIRNLGTLTIQDSSDTNVDGTGDGKLIAGASSTWTWDGTDNYAGSYASNLIRNEGTLVVNSGFLNNISTGSAAYAIDNYSAGKVTINGGKVDAAKASAIRMFYVKGGSLTVNGGTVGHYNSDDNCSYYGIQVMSGENANVSVTGGTIAGEYALYANNTGGSIAVSGGTCDGYVGFGSAGPSDISISGGTFTCWVGTWGSQTGFISGGEFLERVEAVYCAEGFICSEEPNADGYYTIKEGSYVALVGDYGYETFTSAAIDANGKTAITLLADISEGYIMTAGETLMVALNGHTLTVNPPADYDLVTSEPDANGVTTYTLVEKPDVAMIGEIGYKSLKAAVAAAVEGDTITLIADDRSLEDGSELEINKSLTITGAKAENGEPLYTIFGKSTATGTNDIFITGSGTVTLSNLKIKNFGNDANTNPGHAPVYVSTNFTGTVALVNVYISDFNRGGIFLYGGAFEVNDCYIDCANSRSGAFTKGIEIKGSATGTIDNTLICNMERSSNSYMSGGIEVMGSGDVEIKDCTILSNNDSHSSTNATYGIVVAPVGQHDPSGGSLQVTGTMIDCENACLSVEAENYEVTLDDCDFSNYIANWSSSSSTTTSSITINSGSYAKDIYAEAGTIYIKGGEFSNFAPDTEEGASIQISGGTFDAPVLEEYCAPGFIPVEIEEGVYSVKEGAFVAEIDGTKYESLEAAFAAAQDGETITLLADCAGNGIKVPQGKFTTGLTVDFDGHTYTMDGSLVGSTGTQTQAFQLLKDNTIVFKNGTIVADSEGVQMMIQNYSNITLDNMTLDATVGTNSIDYVLSTNNGSTTINDTKITAKEGHTAFDACSGWGGYQSNAVEVTGESVITGLVEISYYGQEGTTPASLALTSGTLNGSLVMAEGADKANVTKGESFEVDAPEGYKWSCENGTCTLVAFKIGNVNRDSNVDFADVQAIVNIILDMVPEGANYDMDASNVDGIVDEDGNYTISISDVTALIKLITSVEEPVVEP